MKHTEVMADKLILAGFQPGVNFHKHPGGIYLDGNAANYLIETLHPEMAEDLQERLEEMPFTLDDIPEDKR